MTEQIMSHTSPPVGSDITVEPLHEITLSVNGAPHTATAPARRWRQRRRSGGAG